MIRAYLIAAQALACVILGGLAWFWQDRADDVARRLSVATARLEQVEQAAEVHRAHIKRLEAERATWAAQDRELKSMEGRDAPVSDLLRRSGRVLWP